MNRKRRMRGDSTQPETPAWNVLRHIEHQQQLWERYTDRLTPEERQWLAGGHAVSIVRDFIPDWGVGDWLDVASNLRVRITDVRWARGKCRSSILIQDFRPRLPRHVPQMFDPPERDEHGDPIPHSREAIADATIDGNYTSSHKLAVPDVADEPDEHQHDRLHREAKVKAAYSQGVNRRREDLIRYERRLERARKKGRMGTIRVLEAKIERVRSTLSRVA